MIWKPDGSGFFYSRYDQSPDSDGFATSNVNQKLYFHEIGTPQPSDRLIYERPDKEKWLLRGKATEDGSFLLINVLEGSSF